jgi:hypothetical protein
MPALVWPEASNPPLLLHVHHCWFQSLVCSPSVTSGWPDRLQIWREKMGLSSPWRQMRMFQPMMPSSPGR